MDNLSKEYVIDFFSRKLKMHGDRPEAVSWTSRGQAARFGTLLEINESIEGKKILDYGCGKGDFYQFLRDRNINVSYTGFDINEELISLARRKYPECRFRVFDIEEEPLNEDFDYIFLCGVFNMKLADLHATIKRVLVRLFSHCRIALAFNGLSGHDPGKIFNLNYLDPEDMFNFAVKNLSPYVSLIHDRIPYDFTLHIRKKPRDFV